MTIIYVQYSDASESAIAAVFGCAQDPNAYPNQGEVEDTDPRYLVFVNPPPQAPRSVTMRQARLVLLQAGLLAQVDAAIDALPEPDRTAARIEWEYSQEVQRDKPFVQMLAPALGLNDEQLDALFIQGATL